MQLFKNYIAKVVREEVERVLFDKRCIDQMKTALQADINRQRVNENDTYLDDMRKG